MSRLKPKTCITIDLIQSKKKIKKNNEQHNLSIVKLRNRRGVNLFIGDTITDTLSYHREYYGKVMQLAS